MRKTNNFSCTCDLFLFLIFYVCVIVIVRTLFVNNIPSVTLYLIIGTTVNLEC